MITGEAFGPTASVFIVTGHYGAGKTNFSLNVALDAAAGGRAVTIVDLDVVNPFFRSSDYRDLLEERGVRVISPVFAGTNVDGPSLSGAIEPAIELARRPQDGRDTPPLLVIDAGGDDVGATALGRFAEAVKAGPYEMVYVVNRSRNLTQDPDEAVEIMRQIEERSHLRATAVVNNTHLQGETDAETIERGIPFAKAVAASVGLPLACTTVPIDVISLLSDRETPLTGRTGGKQTLYPVRVYVHAPWDN